MVAWSHRRIRWPAGKFSLKTAAMPQCLLFDTNTSEKVVAADNADLARQDGLSQAIRMVRPRGSVFMKSTLHGKGSDRYGACNCQRNHPCWIAVRKV